MTATAARIAERVATATLFGGGTLVIVDEPGPLIRSRDARTALERALGTVAPGNVLVFLDLLERLPTERRPLTADRLALAAAVRAAGGESRQLQGPGTRMPAWIEERARERGIRLGRGAAAELARRIGGLVRQPDVDRRYAGRFAVGELEKLALLHPDGNEITVADVEALVAEAIPTSSWAFLDALGERRVSQAADMLDRLLATTPEPVLLALLHARIRDLILVADGLAAGASPAELARATKLSGYRLERSVEMAHHWTVEELSWALDGLLELDIRVKGADGTMSTEEQRRFAFVSWVADHAGRLAG